MLLISQLLWFETESIIAFSAGGATYVELVVFTVCNLEAPESVYIVRTKEREICRTQELIEAINLYNYELLKQS